MAKAKTPVRKAGKATASEHVFDGKPDDRQSDKVDMRPSRFRPTYRALQPNEKALHDEIKAKAAEMEVLINRVGRQVGSPALSDKEIAAEVARYRAMAMTQLELVVIWSVKGLTA